MTSISVNPPPTVPMPIVLSSFIAPGEYVDEGGAAPADLPSGVLSNWHLIVENPQGSVLVKQTLVSAPLGGFEQPYPEILIYVRYFAPLTGHANTEQGEGTSTSITNWTSWQQVAG